MVVDYEENKVMFKDNPRVWHELPTTGGERGLMLIPLTEEAVERYTPKNRNVEHNMAPLYSLRRKARYLRNPCGANHHHNTIVKVRQALHYHLKMTIEGHGSHPRRQPPPLKTNYLHYHHTVIIDYKLN